MTRQQKIEKAGYKIIFAISGNCVFAQKGLTKIKGTSVSNLHKQIFGY